MNNIVDSDYVDGLIWFVQLSVGTEVMGKPWPRWRYTQMRLSRLAPDWGFDDFVICAEVL